MPDTAALKPAIGKEVYIAFLSIICIFLYLALHFSAGVPETYSLMPLYIALAAGGTPLLFELLQKLIHGEFGSDFLAGISIITAVILGEYLAGTLVVLMLSGGEALENYAVEHASRVLETLAKRMVTVAHKKVDNRIEIISTGQIAIGDTILIYPHEISPVDGDVIEGHSVMDESYLTGEPFMISKAPGSSVISGAVNGDSSLTIRASRLAIDSRYSKIMQVMRESEQKRPKLRRLADQLGMWYTPIAIIIALAAWFASGEAVRFLAVLVIATPCPLLIAIPVAIIGAISLCAKHAILIKNPVVLEQFDQCQTMIFDKTGTLTYGRPVLSEKSFFGILPHSDVLKLAASLEVYSRHPLAGAILDAAKAEKIELEVASQIKEPPGEGLQGIVSGHQVVITSRKNMLKEGLKEKAENLPPGSGLECVVLIDGQLAANFRFRDAPRSESRSFIHHLAPMHGFKEVMIVSGDSEEEVRYLADRVGIKDVYAGKTPEEKVEIVREAMRHAKTAYLGDGINDAPALTAATVGIAFGLNSDITAEAAGAVIMDNSLRRVDEFLHISRRMRRIALESAIGGMALSILGMIAAAFGYLPPVAGAITQEVIDVLAIVNSLRVAWAPIKLFDF